MLCLSPVLVVYHLYQFPHDQVLPASTTHRFSFGDRTSDSLFGREFIKFIVCYIIPSNIFFIALSRSAPWQTPFGKAAEMAVGG